MDNHYHHLNNEYQYAGFWIRFFATIVDAIILTAVSLPILLFVYGSVYLEGRAFLQGRLDFFISYVFPFIATVLFWVYKSATPGKMLLKLKIVDAQSGCKPTLLKALVRYIGYFVSAIPFGLGFLWVAWDPHKQGWHDKLAGTVVVRPLKKIKPVNFTEG